MMLNFKEANPESPQQWKQSQLINFYGIFLNILRLSTKYNTTEEMFR